MKTTNNKNLQIQRDTIVVEVRETKFTARSVRRTTTNKIGVDWSVSFLKKDGNYARLSGLQTDELVKLYQNLGALITQISDLREALGIER